MAVKPEAGGAWAGRSGRPRHDRRGRPSGVPPAPRRSARIATRLPARRAVASGRSRHAPSRGCHYGHFQRSCRTASGAAARRRGRFAWRRHDTRRGRLRPAGGGAGCKKWLYNRSDRR